MATNTFNLSADGLDFTYSKNIANRGSTTFNTTELPKNGGKAMLEFVIPYDLYERGTINSISISYKAYGTRTGVLGSKAQIKTGYYSNETNDYVYVNSHDDVGRGSSNATSYTDPIKNPQSTVVGGIYIFFEIINPIAAQTNTVYVSNISITVDYTPASYKVTTAVSPTGAGTVTGGGTYEYGKSATLTATANSGYTFSKWSDGVTTNPRTVTVTQDVTYTANFTLNKINKIYVGTSQPKEIYIGTSKVKGIYVGTTKVYG